MCKFCQILCFIFKIYHNFEPYQNMLIDLGFFFLHHKLKFCFVCHAHQTPFTCGKRLLKFEHFEKYFEFLKISNSIFLKLLVLKKHSQFILIHIQICESINIIGLDAFFQPFSSFISSQEKWSIVDFTFVSISSTCD